jgi:hypothetical protein
MSETLKDENKTTTESGKDLIELNGQMVNEVLSKRDAKESFNLMAHLANGAGARDLPRLVDKTDLNTDDKFIVAALVVSANAFCYDIVARKEAEPILGGTDGWKLLSDALATHASVKEAEESIESTTDK